MEQNKYLYLIWKDPQTRRNFVIGKLYHDQKYTFEYYGDYQLAETYGWSKFEVFPLEKMYESETLFPVFASRLPDKRRRDIEKILKKYDLTQYDDFELLRKSGARLPIDNYSFIDPINPDEEYIEQDFFIMGVRHYVSCDGKDCTFSPRVTVNDKLKFERELDNKYDSNAICIKTMTDEMLGYVPRYYNLEIVTRLERGMSYSCKVIEINHCYDCSECIKVRLLMPPKCENL
jgi:HipA-like protein